MRRVLIITLGGILGFGCAWVVMTAPLPDAYHRRLGDLLALVSRPIAIVLSAITGWPLQSEVAIAVHLLAIAILFVVTGMITAGLATRRRA